MGDVDTVSAFSERGWYDYCRRKDVRTLKDDSSGRDGGERDYEIEGCDDDGRSAKASMERLRRSVVTGLEVRVGSELVRLLDRAREPRGCKLGTRVEGVSSLSDYDDVSCNVTVREGADISTMMLERVERVDAEGRGEGVDRTIELLEELRMRKGRAGGCGRVGVIRLERLRALEWWSARYEKRIENWARLNGEREMVEVSCRGKREEDGVGISTRGGPCDVAWLRDPVTTCVESYAEPVELFVPWCVGARDLRRGPRSIRVRDGQRRDVMLFKDGVETGQCVGALVVETKTGGLTDGDRGWIEDDGVGGALDVDDRSFCRYAGFRQRKELVDRLDPKRERARGMWEVPSVWRRSERKRRWTFKGGAGAVMNEDQLRDGDGREYGDEEFASLGGKGGGDLGVGYDVEERVLWAVIYVPSSIDSEGNRKEVDGERTDGFRSGTTRGEVNGVSRKCEGAVRKVEVVILNVTKNRVGEQMRWKWSVEEQMDGMVSSVAEEESSLDDFRVILSGGMPRLSMSSIELLGWMRDWGRGCSGTKVGFVACWRRNCSVGREGVIGEKGVAEIEGRGGEGTHLDRDRERIGGSRVNGWLVRGVVDAGVDENGTEMCETSTKRECWTMGSRGGLWEGWDARDIVESAEKIMNDVESVGKRRDRRRHEAAGYGGDLEVRLCLLGKRSECFGGGRSTCARVSDGTAICVVSDEEPEKLCYFEQWKRKMICVDEGRGGVGDIRESIDWEKRSRDKSRRGEVMRRFSRLVESVVAEYVVLAKSEVVLLVRSSALGAMGDSAGRGEGGLEIIAARRSPLLGTLSSEEEDWKARGCNDLEPILIDHPLRYALTATTDVPVVYLQQFWKTVSKVSDTKDTIRFKLDTQEITYTMDMFRDTLHFPVETPDNLFIAPVNIEVIQSFMQRVGYQGVVDKVSVFYTKFLAQPWQTMFKVFNRFLTTRISGHDQTKINILQFFHVVVNRTNIDYVALLWWDFINYVFQKKDVIQECASSRDADSGCILTKEIRAINDYKEYTPRAHRTPTLTAASPQGKKMKQIFVASMFHDDVDDSGNRIEPGSHKEHPEVVDDDDENEEEKKDDELGSLENRTEKMQTTIPITPRSSRINLCSDKNIVQELTDTVSLSTATTSKDPHKKRRISSKYTHLPGVLRRMCRRQGYMIKDMERKFVADTIIQERDAFQSEVPDLISKEFDAHAPKIIEDLFKHYVQTNVIQVHPTSTTSTDTTSSADLQQQLYLKMQSNLQDQANDLALDNDFYSQHHDDHQDDDAHPEEEKRVKRNKTSKISKSAREWDAWEEETVIDKDKVIPEDETPELITKFQNVDKRVLTIFDRARMEATLNNMLSNQFRNAEEDPNEPPRYLYNKDLFFLKNGNTEEKKYILSLHKIYAELFPEADLEEKMNRWVQKEFKNFNEDARLSIQHWKDSWHKRVYKQNQRKVKDNPEDYFSNHRIA
ncbi:hypothetical protein Tco_0795626 [Tanacetum coccineum]